MFPSPYGDMVLKCSRREWDHHWCVRFPSPYGDMVLKSEGCAALHAVDYGFPSPYGDMVLKLDYLYAERDARGIVSVPLRGYGFEI